VTACIGEPLSWLRLERFALGAPDPAIASHVAACPACRQCLDQIRDDAVALPPLVVPTRRPLPRSRRRWLAPALAAAAAAVVLVVVLRPRPGPPDDRDTISRVTIKGIGEVSLELVRERAGAIAFDARGYAPGDRWKAVVSCPPGPPAALWVDVSVADGITVDHPLAAARIACGNRVVVPGAFTVTGDRANRVCAQITVAVAAGPGADPGTAPGAAPGAASLDDAACLTLVPERGQPR
jgi:hypothetical protein